MPATNTATGPWKSSLTATAFFPLDAQHQDICKLSCPDTRFQSLYNAAVNSLIMHAPGDGHHVRAAAEWMFMMRNCFLREAGNTLIIGAGVPARWLEQECFISFGPAPTAFGPVTLTIVPDSTDQVVVLWKSEWHASSPAIEVRLPGFAPIMPEPGITSLILRRECIAA